MQRCISTAPRQPRLVLEQDGDASLSFLRCSGRSCSQRAAAKQPRGRAVKAAHLAVCRQRVRQLAAERVCQERASRLPDHLVARVLAGRLGNAHGIRREEVAVEKGVKLRPAARLAKRKQLVATAVQDGE